MIYGRRGMRCLGCGYWTTRDTGQCFNCTFADARRRATALRDRVDARMAAAQEADAAEQLAALRRQVDHMAGLVERIEERLNHLEEAAPHV